MNQKNKKELIEVYKKALKDHAQLKHNHNSIIIKPDNKEEIELLIDNNMFWLDDSKSINAFVRRFEKAYLSKPKLKELKIKIKGKHRKATIKEIKFNGLTFFKKHFLIT